jgi:DNA-binding protein HU-beta
MLGKQDLVQSIAEKSGITKAQASVAYDAFKDFLSGGMVSEGRVILPGIGTFTKKHKEEHIRKNPQGNMITVMPKNSVKFKAGKELNDKIN